MDPPKAEARIPISFSNTQQPKKPKTQPKMTMNIAKFPIGLPGIAYFNNTGFNKRAKYPPKANPKAKKTILKKQAKIKPKTSHTANDVPKTIACLDGLLSEMAVTRIAYIKNAQKNPTRKKAERRKKR